MKLSLCIVGCGSYAHNVLTDIHDMTDEFDFYFASRDIEKARRYCEEFSGSGFFGNYHEAASDPRIEAMYFFTPHDMHLDNVRTAAERRKHVLIEKPIARSLEEAQAMTKTARAYEIKLMVAENYRYLNTVQKAREIMNQGPVGNAFGTLRQIEIHDESYSKPSGWRAISEINGGGVFIDGGIHLIDMMLNLGGFPESVYALNPPQLFSDSEGEDAMVVIAKLPGEIPVIISFSRSTPIREKPPFIQLTGSKGKISFVANSTELSIETPQVRRTVRVPEPRRGVRQMVSQFKKVIHEDEEPIMSGHEAIRDLVIVLAAYDSARTGQVVHPVEPQQY